MKKFFASLMVVMFVLCATLAFANGNGNGNNGNGNGNGGSPPGQTETLTTSVLSVGANSSVFAGGITYTHCGPSLVMGGSYNKSTATAQLSGSNPVTALTTTGTFGISGGTAYKGMFFGGFLGGANAYAGSESITQPKSNGGPK